MNRIAQEGHLAFCPAVYRSSVDELEQLNVLRFPELRSQKGISGDPTASNSWNSGTLRRASYLTIAWNAGWKSFT